MIFFIVLQALIGAAPSFAEDLPPTGVTVFQEDWHIRFQATTVTQAHSDFNAAYSGANSLSPYSEGFTSLTSTIFAGARLWPGAQAYLNPELSAGAGLSGTHGVAGFPNGEIYRVDTPSAKLNLSRLYLQQVFGLGGEKQIQEASANQLSGAVDQNRITLTFGKFSLNDFFDNNAYSHDPRTQFLNWSLMDNGAWDYAADTRGYTYAFMIEYNQASFAARFAVAMLPKEANQMDFDTDLSHANAENLELEYRYALGMHPGTARFLAYANHARMGSYRDTLNTPAYGMDVTLSRGYRTKYGFGLNLEQELSSTLGVFTRLGWNDGATESWCFTEVDRTISLGARLRGESWNRSSDELGLALILNGLSQDHSDYLAAGGYGFIIGDGRLSYAPEQILETYYLYKFIPMFGVSGNVQWVNHPAYNSDRGPATIFALRTHLEF